MRLSRALKDKLMDVRLRDKLHAEGKLTKTQTADYLSRLSDETGNYLFTADVNEAEKAKAEEALSQSVIE